MNITSRAVKFLRKIKAQYKLRRYEKNPFSKPVPDDVKLVYRGTDKWYNMKDNIRAKLEKIPVVSNERAEERRKRN